MSPSYTIKQAIVRLPGGVEVHADVSSADAVRQLLQDLKGLQSNGQHQPIEEPDTTREPPEKQKAGPSDTGPASRVETRADLASGSLAKRNVLAFKGDVPQLLRPTAFSITDALLLLLFAVETGLKKSKVDYDSFKDLFEAQNIKTGSPLSMLAGKLQQMGYLDKKAYGDDRSFSLTAKGEKKAAEVLKGALE